MLSLLKKFFGSRPADPDPAPYKVEKADQFPFPRAVEESKPAATAKKPAAKKPAAKKPAVKTSKQ